MRYRKLFLIATIIGSLGNTNYAMDKPQPKSQEQEEKEKSQTKISTDPEFIILERGLLTYVRNNTVLINAKKSSSKDEEYFIRLTKYCSCCNYDNHSKKVPLITLIATQKQYRTGHRNTLFLPALIEVTKKNKLRAHEKFMNRTYFGSQHYKEAKEAFRNNQGAFCSYNQYSALIYSLDKKIDLDFLEQHKEDITKIINEEINKPVDTALFEN